MQAVLIIIHLLVAMGLISVVLLQRSEGGALGMGGGGSGLGGLFSPRGAANTLTKTTAILGILFFVTSMALTLLTLGARQPNSILNAVVPATGAPANPNAPPTLPSRGPTPPTLPNAAPAPAPGAPAGTAPAKAPAAPALPSVPQTR
jgi:preprotein translocase subunit SecG